MIQFLLKESFIAALRSMRMHRMRSILTSLGIAVGVAATIFVVSIINGFSDDINARFTGFGANSITIQPKNSFENQLKGRISYLRHSDLALIERRVEGVSHLTPEMSVYGRFRAPVSYGGSAIVTDVRGTSSTWQDLMRVYTVRGRFLVPSDGSARRRVGVIGPSAASQLRMPDDPLGEFVQVGTTWIKIVGVLEKRGKSMGIDQDDLLILPYETGLAMSNLQRDPSFWIQMQVADVSRMPLVIERIRALLRRNHDIPEGEEDDFEIQTSTQFMEAFNEMTMSVSLISAGIMAVSMLVGGIGIMNMMLVSVAERTREIGILKALGATRAWIISGFMSEAVFMSLLGCVAGLGLSALAIFAIGLLPDFPSPSTPVWAIVASVGFCMLVGAVFGIVPAVKAANMEPIDAIKS